MQIEPEYQQRVQRTIKPGQVRAVLPAHQQQHGWISPQHTWRSSICGRPESQHAEETISAHCPRLQQGGRGGGGQEEGLQEGICGCRGDGQTNLQNIMKCFLFLVLLWCIRDYLIFSWISETYQSVVLLYCLIYATLKVNPWSFFFRHIFMDISIYFLSNAKHIRIYELGIKANIT